MSRSKSKKIVLNWAEVVKLQVSNVSEQVLSTMAGGVNGLSRDFFDFLKAIGDAKSKQEEERIVSKEIRKLKLAISKPDTIKVSFFFHP